MNEQHIIGTVHRFGDNINTDLICPGQYMELPNDKIAAYAMIGANADFPKKVQIGDIIVAGKNFGSGSSRETAPQAIKSCGVSLVIAEFFARIFYRNCINIGLPVLILPDTSKINDGDNLEVNLRTGEIRNNTSGEVHLCDPISERVMEILNAGGLIPLLEHKLLVSNEQ